MCLFDLKMSDSLSNNDISFAIALLPSTLLNTCEQEQSGSHGENDRPSAVFVSRRRSYHWEEDIHSSLSLDLRWPVLLLVVSCALWRGRGDAERAMHAVLHVKNTTYMP